MTEARIISSGTLRPQDLLPAFLSEALANPEKLTRNEARILAGIGEAASRPETDPYWDTDLVQWDMEEVTDILAMLAPAGTYFGASEGDGACFGFWPCDDDGEE